ncbi:MAG: lasso peptide isopeptide bond-forming cyclase [Cyanothece sp. SIO1E1]|nr:lasso peptide isopeptide bond-forming cyclase [Cyanothece sp. SIO1E1]
MSGIMGIYHLDERLVNREMIQKMSDTLAHRGPDGADIWCEGSVGLGHRMLWTTPESLLEKLPQGNQTGNLVITADARIDNRDELAAVLNLPDCSLEKITDSEFILAAYEKWGESCPAHLLGDFAFAIWDKFNQTLFCARDHLGVKPFYYYHQPDDLFLFASEMKALFCSPQVPRQLNEVRIADFIALSLKDKVITTYQDILRLPPAHSMSIGQTGIRLWPYWSLDPNYEIKLTSDEAYAEAFRDIFTEAVRCRLRSAFPIGSHLSGGLDSSSITCVARKLLEEEGRGRQLHTFSNIFDDVPECDERPFISAVIDQGGLIPHYIHADQFGPWSDLEEIWQYEDEALMGPSHFYGWRLNRATQQAGVRVFFDGLDGDNVVCHGLHKLTELAYQGQWQAFADCARAIAQKYKGSPRALLNKYGLPCLPTYVKQSGWFAFAKAVQQIHQHFGSSRKTLILEYGLKPLLPKYIQQCWRKLRGQQQDNITPAALINREFAERIGITERIRVLNRTEEPPKTVKEAHWRALTQGLFSYALEQLDRSASAFSLESRHPFMDKRLIEFCLALPTEQKLHQGWGRVVMRRALASILPEAIQWRGGKTSMTPNFLYGIRKTDRCYLEHVISHQLKPIEAYIKPDLLKAAYQRVISGKKLIRLDDMTIWRATVLAAWFNRTKLGL